MSELSEAPDVTQLLLDWNRGRREALDELMPLVIQELRWLARKQLRGERSGHTLQPTALVNEAYLRLVDRERVSWESRAHFFAFAARVMRRVLVDHARQRNADKRGGGVAPITLDEGLQVVVQPEVDVLEIDRALSELSALDARQGELVELRFFGGLTLRESAAVLGVGEATVSRDWSSARAWLHRRLAG